MTPHSDRSSRIPGKKHRLWPWVAGVPLILAVLGILAVPVASRHYLTRWLLANGADQAVIGRVRFNPFTGTASLEGVDVRQQGKTVLSDATIAIDLGMRALLNRHAVLSEVRLVNVTLDMALDDKGNFRVGSYTIPASDPEAPGQKSDSVTVARERKPWIFRVMNLQMDNVIIHYAQPDLSVTLEVDQGELSGFNTDPEDHTGSIQLTGRVNGAPVQLNLSTFSIIPEVTVIGDVTVKSFNLGQLSALLRPWLDPFAGRVSLHGRVDFQMPDDAGMRADYQGTIAVSGLDLAGNGWATGGELSWKGQARYGDSPDKGITISLDGDLLGKTVRYSMPDPAININGRTVLISGRTDIGIDDAVTVHSSARLTSEPLAFAMEPMKTGYESFSWKGRIDFTTGVSNNPLRVDLDGALAVRKPSFRQDREGEKLVVRTDEVDWQGKGSYVLGDQAGRVGLNGGIDLSQARLELANMGLDLARLRLENSFGLEIGDNLLLSGVISAKAKDVKIQDHGRDLLLAAAIRMDRAQGTESGGIQVKDLRAQDITLVAGPDQPFAVSVPRIGVSGLHSEDFRTLTLDRVRVDKPAVTDTRTSRTVAALESIEARGVMAGTDPVAVRMEKITGRKGRFMEEQRKKGIVPVATLAAIDIDGVSWSAREGAVIGTVVADGLLADVLTAPESGKKSADTGTDSTVNPAATGDEKVAVDRPEKKNAPGLPLRIDTVQIKGNSGVRYSDTTMTVAFSTFLGIKSLEVRGVDLNQPEQPFTYTLSGSMDRYAPLTVSGSCAPLAPQLVLKQKLELRNYSVDNLSPYLIESIGTRFTQGQMDLTSDLSIAAGRLEAKNHLYLKDVEIATVRKELADKLNNQLPVPLDMALSLLRDRHDNITLEIPISGRLDDLNVGISDVLVTALSSAITTAVAPYLAYTVLGPAGALAYLGLQAGQAIMDTSFDVLAFDPGQIELNEAQQKILDRIGKTIVKQKEGDYSLCARVNMYELPGVKADQGETREEIINNPANRKALFLLGTRRATAVRQYLVQKFGIDGDRLLICKPSPFFDPQEKSAILIRK